MMKKEEGSWGQYDEKRRRIMGSSAMKKRRRTYRHGKGDCIMYGFTIALCIFTVFVLLSGGKKSGQGGTEAAGEAAAGSGTQTAGNGGRNQAADTDGAQTPDEVRGQKGEEDAVSEQPWNREAMSKQEMTRVSEMKRIQGKIPAAVQDRVPGLVRKAVQGRIQMAGSRRLR